MLLTSRYFERLRLSRSSSTITFLYYHHSHHSYNAHAHAHANANPNSSNWESNSLFNASCLKCNYTQADYDDLIKLETGGQMELQRWMKDYDDIEPRSENLSQMSDIDSLLHIENQGRVGFIWKRQ